MEGYFGSQFRGSAIIAELWRPEVARPGNFVSNFWRDIHFYVRT